MCSAVKKVSGRIAVAIALAACAAAAPAADAYQPPPTIPWSSLLPGLPTRTNPQFSGATGCATPAPSCIDNEIARMDALRQQLGCDHRAVFTTTYELLTITFRDALRDGTAGFQDPKWVIGEDGVFADLYFKWFDRYQRGQAVPAAWRVAFNTARTGDANAIEDMLLGINAHVQRDMPYMLAAVGLHTPGGVSHKVDHDRFNELLNRAFQSVTDSIAQRFDPIENLIAPSFNPVLGLVGNISGDQLVQAWREGVWRNAERLLNAPTPAARRRVEASIEANAALWAHAIAAIQFPPGYRVSRDAYCALHVTQPLPH